MERMDDLDFRNPESADVPLRGRGSQNVSEDSVPPVHRAGRTELRRGGHRRDGRPSPDTARGHVPGSSVPTPGSRTDHALFVEDLPHSPVHGPEPGRDSRCRENRAAARATRRGLLGRAADHGALVLSARPGGHGAAEAVRHAEGSAIKDRAPFTAHPARHRPTERHEK